MVDADHDRPLVQDDFKRRCQSPALYFDFDADLPYIGPSHNKGGNQSCAFYQAEKPRRGVRLGLDAPAIVNHHRSYVRIILYGTNERGKSWLARRLGV